MASKIKVDQIAGSSGSTITVPTGQTLTLTDGLAVASLPTVTVAKGGTNLTSFTAGDVLYATGATTLAKLPKGSAADVLTMNSGATAPEWAASAGGGKIGQVVSAIHTARETTSSATPVTTNITATITPTATSSKIWIVINCGSISSSGVNNRVYFHLNGGNGATYVGASATGSECAIGITPSYRADYTQFPINLNYLDSPSTTSATTYTLFFRNDTGSCALNSSYVQNADSGNSASSITLMEVLA